MTKMEKIKAKRDEGRQKLKALGPVKLVVLAILLAGTICSYVFYDFIHGANNYFTGVNPDTGVAWDYGSKFLNDLMALIPRVIMSMRFITILLVIVTIALVIVKKFFNKTPRGITVGGLIMNLIRWLTAIVLILVVLYQWGVDATALITGAGVVTLVIGLGMQSLIADVIAGLFIVFENEFNVGDWITVDGFRGQVESIGIRTTRLKVLGNIKIINNNAIQWVLNHSTENSIAFTHIDIEYGAKIPKVEEIIRTHLAEIKVPGSLSEVRYDGVKELGASGVTLQFEVDCYEGDIYAVGRAMNGLIKNMFDENGVGIPFPQIVVHKGK